ncbi:sulfotransferase 1A3-like [Pomacea canaliculata]|uniref:sulfotransferase 1A3-like n=1 Tax=Pomacea canaliculata TaxID=400727 RepID=UPI000D73E383|nr:sulfotransferase 1A3-like [Pomacea canaliculata]XP_025083690.1 sulfotransferase 1A3-like [Pomacea canaliculata]XP_025083691.1 sulfotransferase 1A3-like [Pomacea canaliculata]XP_025083692.1 sulfotransferase 1A3-like [Pomacea canaliculata]XP_025083693.1 sulfotransferase 1A3-like [Pomacea canaliculata]
MMMLLRGQAETITFKKSLHMIEFNSAANIGEFQSPRVLNSHVLYADLPHEVHTRRLKIVFVCRNPKDVAVSLYNHHVKLSEYYEYSGEFKDWLELFVEGKVDYGSWFDYTNSWENVIYGDRVNPIHVVMYEDMKEDPSRETKRLADFLGVSCSSDLISAVVTKCGFDHMKEDKKPHQNHSEVMFRKGVVGDWKNYFTVAQNEAFDAILAERMKGSKLQVRYQL